MRFPTCLRRRGNMATAGSAIGADSSKPSNAERFSIRRECHGQHQGKGAELLPNHKLVAARISATARRSGFAAGVDFAASRSAAAGLQSTQTSEQTLAGGLAAGSSARIAARIGATARRSGFAASRSSFAASGFGSAAGRSGFAAARFHGATTRITTRIASYFTTGRSTATAAKTGEQAECICIRAAKRHERCGNQRCEQGTERHDHYPPGNQSQWIGSHSLLDVGRPCFAAASHVLSASLCETTQPDKNKLTMPALSPLFKLIVDASSLALLSRQIASSVFSCAMPKVQFVWN